MSATDVRSSRLSSRTRRMLVHGSLIAVALIYVGFLVVAPLVGIAWAALSSGWHTWSQTLTSSDARHAYMLTLEITLIAVTVSSVFGVIVALVLSRDKFPGNSLLSAVADLPVAISPVIVGLMAVLLFGRGGWFEPWFTAHGIQVLFAVPSMALVTLMICIPFVIREVVPTLQELGIEEEQAAKTLGASSAKTFFRVTLPNIRWALAYGVALSTARAIGEVGAVIVVSGAIVGRTETATLYVMRMFDQGHDGQGYVVALTLALVSITILSVIEFAKRRDEARRSL